MSDAESPAAAGGPVPEGAELRAALTGFLSDFKSFQADVKTRIINQEERLTMLDRKTITAARPALALETGTAEAPHAKAFEAYLRSGDDDGLRALEFEGKALSTAVAADGGYLVDPQTAETIRSVLLSASSIRAVANVVQVESTSFDVLVDHGELGSGWASETASQIETDTPQIERISIHLHELSAMPKVSQRLLDDSAFDIDGWLAQRIADKFARAEAAAFVNGDGADKPRGFLNHTVADDAAWAWGQIGYIATGADGAFNGAEALIDLVYALGAQYRARAAFVMNSRTAGAVRKLKDGDGRFLWADGLAAGEPARLMGYPVLVAEDMRISPPGRTRSRSATSRPATQSPSGLTFGCCAIRSRPSRMCCSTPPAAWAAT